ncbi:MAG: hypothetical protein J1E05_07980 [Eubacterium sp.]|nr:hypothetical protein [Eubacterium sp.]
MKLEDFKNSIDNIKPDLYMETRLAQKVYEAAPKKRSKRKLAVAAVSGFLSLAILITALGFGGLWRSQNFYVGNDGSCVPPNENTFILSVYASETDEPIYTQIDDDMVTLPDYKLNDVIPDIVSPDLDGAEYIETGDLSFEIKGENIESVRIQCEKSEFHIIDFTKFEYLKANDEWYDFVVPYSDEYAWKSNNECIDIMLKHIENGDYDEYIVGKEIKSADEYAGVEIIYDENGNEIGVGLVSVETYSKFSPTVSTVRGERNFVKDYTFINLFEEKEFSCHATVSPLVWYEILFEDINTPFSQLPHDTIKINVTFNDGTVKYGKYDLSLNDNGELVIKTLA